MNITFPFGDLLPDRFVVKWVIRNFKHTQMPVETKQIRAGGCHWKLKIEQHISTDGRNRNVNRLQIGRCHEGLPNKVLMAFTVNASYYSNDVSLDFGSYISNVQEYSSGENYKTAMDFDFSSVFSEKYVFIVKLYLKRQEIQCVLYSDIAPFKKEITFYINFSEVQNNNCSVVKYLKHFTLLSQCTYFICLCDNVYYMDVKTFDQNELTMNVDFFNQNGILMRSLYGYSYLDMFGPKKNNFPYLPIQFEMTDIHHIKVHVGERELKISDESVFYCGVDKNSFRKYTSDTLKHETYISPICNRFISYRMKMVEKVTFIVDNSRIQMPKEKLLSVSDVFAAMFNSKMKESSTNIIHIDDFSADVIEQFVSFYTTPFMKLPRNDCIIYLYLFGDKYNIDDLKKSCLDQMIKSLKPVSLCAVNIDQHFNFLINLFFFSISLDIKILQNETCELINSMFNQNVYYMRKFLNYIQRKIHEDGYCNRHNTYLAYVNALNNYGFRNISQKLYRF